MHGARAGAPSGTAHGRYRHGLYTCDQVAIKGAIEELLDEVRHNLRNLGCP